MWPFENLFSVTWFIWTISSRHSFLQIGRKNASNVNKFQNTILEELFVNKSWCKDWTCWICSQQFLTSKKENYLTIQTYIHGRCHHVLPNFRFVMFWWSATKSFSVRRYFRSVRTSSLLSFPKLRALTDKRGVTRRCFACLLSKSIYIEPRTQHLLQLSYLLKNIVFNDLLNRNSMQFWI